ncbi:MAG: UbiD family decarboxylase [Desulfuromonadales bacterium]
MKPPKSIGDFLQYLGEHGELHEIEREVETDQEIAVITEMVSKKRDGGKALLFTRVAGHSWPVATNLFGSRKRMAMAMNVSEIDHLGKHLEDGLGTYRNEKPEEAFRKLIGEPAWRPVSVQEAPCRETKASVNLTQLPALKSWPGEGGRFLTLPMVHTRDPYGEEVNCGMYRLQIISEERLTINWSESSDGAKHHQAWARKGEAMPVAISLGGPPAAICSAAMPLPTGVDEMAMSGFLNREPVTVTAVGDAGLEVPAQAEIVLEGVIEPGEGAMEGPFGNHTGFYTEPKQCPVMRIKSITHRENPIYPCTVVGPPPMEDCYMARAMERLFLPLWQRMFPLLADIHLPFEGIFHGCAILAVQGNEPGRGSALIRQMWESAAFRHSRLLVAVDAEVDIRNVSGVFWRALNRVDAQRDVLIDGERVGIDATGLLMRGGRSGSSKVLRSAEEIREKVRKNWRDYGFDG